MTVSYKGLDCLADADSPEYMMYHEQSQAAVPWTYQPHYGYVTIYFGCAFIGIALIKHLYFQLRDATYGNKRGPSVITSLMNVVVSYSRFFGYKQVPATISYYTSLPSSFGSSLFLIGSSLYLFLWCLVPHFWYRGCRGFGSPPLAVRAGLMSTALTPFIYILAGKANLLSFVSGISYEKLNYIHQYVGVAAMVLGLIHTIPFFYQSLAEGGSQNLKSKFSEFYYYSGVPPLVLLILLCTLSKASIRKRMYEGFWHLHWIMGAGYFATLTWHTTGSLGSYDYMWSALAFWASQVIYRILIKTAFKPNALFLRPSEAKLFKLKGSTGYQVNVANRAIKWRPGQHVYLRFKSKLLDNHPFSVANLPDESSQELKFIIIPKRGLTKVLYDKIDSVLSEKVYLDGPYGGSSRNHHKFENVYLLASGSGVTATVGFLTDLADKILSGENNITQVVNFVWIVRRHEDIDWFRTELLKAAECKAVNITIYVASEPTDASRVSEIGGFEKLAGPETKMSTADDAGATEFEELLESRSTDGLVVLYEKPNMSRLISSYRFRLGRRNFFVSSGSDSMKMQVSAAVSDLQPIIFNNDLYDTSVEEIYLHTESFGW